MTQEPIKQADVREIVTAIKGALGGNTDIKDQILKIPMRPELLDTAREVVAVLGDKHIILIAGDESNKSLTVMFDKNSEAIGAKNLASKLAELSVDEVVTVVSLRRDYDARLAACVRDKIGQGNTTLKQYINAMGACELPVRRAFLDDLNQRDKTGAVR